MGKRKFEDEDEDVGIAQSVPSEKTNMVPGLTVTVRGFEPLTKPSLVKSLISSFSGLTNWELKSSDSAAHLIATFDSLEHAQSLAYKLRKKSWNGVKLTSEVFAGGSDDSVAEIKEELKRLVEKRRLLNATANSNKKMKMNQEMKKSGRVIVRNLPFNVDESQLKKIFKSKTGCEVEDVQFPVKSDGRKRGFAFVQFSKREDAVNAVSKFEAGHSIKGRPIAVDLSVPKQMHVKLTTQNTNQKEQQSSSSLLVLGDDQYIGDEGDVVEGEDDDDDDDVMQHENEDGDDDAMMDDEDQVDDIEEKDVNFSDDDDDDDGDHDDDDDESEEEDQDDHLGRKRRGKPRPSDVNEGKTIFIKGLPFNVEDADLSDFFSRFGEVTMAKIVLDRETEESKGCGFVKFKDAESVSKCLERLNSQLGLIMERRKLRGELAISREDFEKRKQDSSKKSQLASLVDDKRNLHLARVGLIRGESVSKMSKHDLKLRDDIERLKKMKLRNSNIVMSSTRLCIHNVPTKWNNKRLRSVCMEAAGGKDNGADITECRIMKSKNEKLLSGLGRSLGFAFVSFSTHQHALKVLYALNDNASTFSDQKRPVVEFSMENMLALQKKERRLLKAKMNLPKDQQTSTNPESNKKKKKNPGAGLNSHTLNYKSKKKLKKYARTPLFENSTSADAENNAQFDLPKAVISNMTAKELKQRLKNPMPKKTVSTSVDPKALKANFKKQKRDSEAKKANKQFSLAVAERRANRSRRKNSGKYLNEPTRDKLDDVIEKHMAKRGN